MKIKNFICASFGFICVCSGMSLIFSGNANITTVALIIPAFAAATVTCFYGYKNLRRTKLLKVLVCVWSVVSCSVSVVVASKLVTNTGIIDKSHFVLMIFMTTALALAVAVSKKEAVKSVALIVSGLSALVFVIIAVLSVIDTGFTAPDIVSPEFEMLVPLIFLSVVDVVFVIPFCKSKTPVPIIVGGTVATAFFTLVVMVALSVLTNDVYYALEMPLVKFWQSTYIPSFVNRFEIVALSFLYLLTAFKCGIVLYQTVHICNRKYSLLITLPVLVFSGVVSFL